MEFVNLILMEQSCKNACPRHMSFRSSFRSAELVAESRQGHLKEPGCGPYSLVARTIACQDETGLEFGH